VIGVNGLDLRLLVERQRRRSGLGQDRAQSGDALIEQSSAGFVAVDMMTAALRALVTKFDLAGETLGDVALGAVIKHSRDFNLARESVLSSGLAAETPAFDVQRACGTSL
jgi:acetyl-CoA acetyltransferase